MEVFVEKNATLDAVTDPHVLVDRVPGMRDSMEAVAELRDQYRQDGTQGYMYEHKGWKHVASIRGPVMAVAELLDPEFLNGNGKRTFYSWLDRNPGYCTYDRRKNARSNTHFRFDGSL